MGNITRLIQLLLLLPLASDLMANAFTFTDKRGRSFDGQLVGIVTDKGKENAKIRRERDGRMFLVPLDVLSVDSLGYVEDLFIAPFARSSARESLEKHHLDSLVISEIEIELFVQLLGSILKTEGGQNTRPIRFLVQGDAKKRKVSIDQRDVSLAVALDATLTSNGLVAAYEENQVTITIGVPIAKIQEARNRELRGLPNCPNWLERGVKWLESNQCKDGTWGLAGTSLPSNRSPKRRSNYSRDYAVRTGDAGTTALVVMALSNYLAIEKNPAAQRSLDKAVDELVDLVSKKSDGAFDQSGTLVQGKLGPEVNTALLSQALAKLYLDLPDKSAEQRRIGEALDICLEQLEETHQLYLRSKRGWANILQSAACLSAWEYAELCGRKTDQRKIKELRSYLSGIFNEAANTFDLSRAAGINLYSFAAAIRANALPAATAFKLLPEKVTSQKHEMKMDDPVRETPSSRISYSNSPTGSNANMPTEFDYLSDPSFIYLAKHLPREKALELSRAYRKNEKLVERLGYDNAMLRGFGNNGGEEYLSFYLIGQALQLAGGDLWDEWRKQVVNIVKAEQEQKGHWIGKHCITDASFCTAAVILSVLADREGAYLQTIRDSSD